MNNIDQNILQEPPEIADGNVPIEIFGALIDSTPAGMMIVDRRGTIEMANALLHEIFGYPARSLLGVSVDELLPKAFRKRHRGLREGYYKQPEKKMMGEGRDLFGMRRDGSRVPLEVALSPLVAKNELHVLVTIVDLTLRKQLEDRLRTKSEEMERLLYVASHDMKSPLVTIEGFAGLLETYLEQADHEKAIDAIERIHRGVKTMSRLISDLLEISHIRSSEIQFEEVLLESVIGEVIESLGQAISDAKAKVKQVPPLPAVYADRVQLYQVIQNLVGNALKYACTEPGKTIRVGAIQQETETLIFVRDRGPGIPLDKQETVFQMFSRLDSKLEGTGLGLATVKRIAEVHQGRAWVESKPGSGATFWVSFPNKPVIHRELTVSTDLPTDLPTEDLG